MKNILLLPIKYALNIVLLIVISSSFVIAQLSDELFRPILGEERILFIRVDYSDDDKIVLSDERAPLHADAVEAIMEANSYGLLSFDIDITPILTMPQPKSFYELEDRLWAVRLRSDALKIAEDAGFAVEEYDREAIFTVKVWPQPYSGMGGANNRTIYTRKDNVAHTCHEFGHTFDWRHANLWNSSSLNPLDLDGTMVDYGDKFDIMGDFDNPHHFNPWNKWRASWLPPESILTVTESGNYIIRGLELTPLTGSQDAYTALRIRRTPIMEFIVYYRSQELLANEGAMISLVAPANLSHCVLLDMTPGSKAPSQDYEDAALLVGETVIDNLSGIELTLVQKSDDSLLVNVIVPEEPIDILPKIKIISPEVGLTIQDAVDYEVTAFDPDIGLENGAGIDMIKYSLGYVAGDNPYIDEGTEFIELVSGQSTSPPYTFHVETSGLRDECYRLVVQAISENGGINRAAFNHIIDNTGSSVVSSVEEVEAMDVQIQLRQNVPNPFQEVTTINYNLKQSGQVTLSVYDLFGRKVQTLVQGYQTEGWHSVLWDGYASDLRNSNNGMYIYELRVGESVLTKRMLLLKE